MIGSIMPGFAGSKQWRIIVAHRPGKAFQEYGRLEVRSTFETIRLYVREEKIQRVARTRGAPIQPMRLLAPGGVIAAEWPPRRGRRKSSSGGRR